MTKMFHGSHQQQKHQEKDSDDSDKATSVATPSLCYCVHDTIDTDDEMTVLDLDGKPADRKVAAAASAKVPPFIPAVIVTEDEENKVRKKKKKSSKSFKEQTTMAPMVIVKVMPPTPTATTPDCETARTPMERPTSMNLPTINLPAEFDDDDDGDGDDEEVCGEERNGSGVNDELNKGLGLGLHNGGEDDDNDPNLPVAPCEIRVECDPSENVVDTDEDKPASKPQKRGRKRRKSLVNILFPVKSAASTPQQPQPPTTPTLEAPQGQRLHFRRVSELFFKSSNSKQDSLELIHNKVSAEEAPATCDADNAHLSIKNLFPYRRRRSSVSHLDNTEQFKETRDEIIQVQRRRMSSFPPMDGDESAIMLEKANIVRLEKVHQEALAMQSGNTVTKAFRKLRRRGSRSPSPSPVMSSLFPGMSKKSKWKSSTDVSNETSSYEDDLPSSSSSSKKAQQQQQQQQQQQTPTKRFWDRRRGSSCSQSPGSALSDRPRRNSTCYGESLSSVNSSPSFATVISDVAAAEAAKGQSKAAIVFPKRKLEDVPGIFIPSKSKPKPSRTKTTEDALAGIMGEFESSNLLSVMKNKPRRHSMSDPIFLQTYAANNPSKPLLLPRSPYSTDGGSSVMSR